MTSSLEGAETEIGALLDEWVDALQAKDVARRTAAYAPDVALFDVVNPLRHSGLAALQARLASWFSTFAGPIGCEIRELDITADESIAFCHSLNRFHGTINDGGTLDMWVRFTVCLRKSDGRWLVTHEHASVPFDPATGTASLDVSP